MQLASKNMQAATYVYLKYLGSSGFSKKLWAVARIALIKMANDPLCVLSVHGRPLEMPLSHALPAYLQAHEKYDSLPGRISDYMHLTRGSFKCIDVGANIGDSIAAFYKNDRDLFLAIEPNPNFFRYLVSNWAWNRNVKMISAICSSDSVKAGFAIKEKAGTASIVEASGGVVMTRQPLDEIVRICPEFGDADILKIDTDGHDFDVIAGAANLISSSYPAVLFECDVFESQGYLKDCLDVLRLFQSSGYNQCLVYDNFGYLMGKYLLEDLSSLKRLFFYQLTSKFYYFDILVMKDSDIAQFYMKEVDYFVSEMRNKTLQWDAFAAAEVA